MGGIKTKTISRYCPFKPVNACDRYTLYSETVSDPGYESEEERLPTSALIKPPPRQAPSALGIVCI
jgi:hypothetical protein